MRRRSFAIPVSFCLLCVLCASVVKSDADWPVFRGNAPQTGVAKDTLPDKLEVRWKVKLGDGIEAAAVVHKGVVYVGSFDEHLYALDLATGKERWKYKAGPIKAPPGVRDGSVYVGDEEGVFHCVDAAKGSKRWTFETNGEITSGANFAGDRVLFGSHDSTLYCLTESGKLAWKYKTEGPVYGAPTVAEGRTFLAGCDSILHFIDVKSGQKLAALDLGGQSGATAAVAGEKLYVGTMANQVQAVDLKKRAIEWTFEPERSQPFFSSAAVTDKLVVLGCRDRYVYALDRATGKEAWSFPTRGRVDSSPVVVGKRVYVGSTDGHLYVLDLATGKEAQKVQLGRSVLASPVVADGCLVIGTTDGLLYCLGSKN